MLEVLTSWSGLGRSPKTTVQYYEGDDAAAAPTAITAATALWTLLKPYRVPSSVATPHNVVRNINPSTGTLVDIYTIAPQDPIPGTANSEQVADATQLLLQWQTGVVVNGRQVRGRTFVPGLAQGAMSAGNLSPGVAASLTTALGSWLAAHPILSVWHRPGPLGSGSAHRVITATAWNELAVQRRRRG